MNPMGRFLLILSLTIGLVFPAAAQTPDRSGPPPVGPAPDLVLPAIDRFTLSNGLSVWLVETHRVPLVQVNLLIGAGRVDEAADQAGLAGLTADLLDEGAGDRDALALADEFEYLGARFSIDAGFRETSLSLRVPVTRFAPALDLFSDVVLHPAFPEAELERLRMDRLTALLARHDDPNVIARTWFDRTLFGPDHPMGRGDLGTEATLRAFSVADVRAFHAAFFHPNNARMIVVGDVTPDDLRARLEEALGAWAPAEVAHRPVPPVPPLSGRTVYLIDKPGAAQSVIRIGRPGVPRSTPDYYAIEVMNTVLGGSFTSRLNQNLREDKGYTYGARSSFEYDRDIGLFMAGAAVQTDVTAPALTEFMKELVGIHRPIPSDEFERAKNFLAMRFPARFESVSQVAGQLGDLYTYDLPPETFGAYTREVLAVTPAQAQEAARKYVDPDHMIVVVVGDLARIEAPVRALDLGPVKVLSVRDVLGAPPELGTP